MGDDGIWFGDNMWFGAERMTVADVSEDKVENPKKALMKFIRGDRHLSFCRLLNSQREKTNANANASIPSPKEIIHSICSHRAELCFMTMIFDNPRRMKLNVAVEGDLYPLHFAAQSLWFLGTQLIFYDPRAPTDLPSDDPSKFPLTFALNSIRDYTCASEWNPKISIFKLIYIFCLPEMREPLETLKLLASKTEQLNTIASRCVLQGQVVQLTALLLVAWDKLVKPFSDQGVKGCPIGQLILSELQHYQENCISQSSDTSPEIHEHGANVENAWKVIEILDIARNTIDECRAKDVQSHDVPFLVAYELQYHHNIYLEPEDKYADDVKCLRPRLTPKQKAWLFRSIDKKIRSVATLPTMSEILPTLSKGGGAERVGSLHSFHTVAPKMKLRRSTKRVESSHSFHTLAPNMNVVKPVTSQLSQACQKPGTFSSFLRAQGISSSMPRLFSALKRM